MTGGDGRDCEVHSKKTEGGKDYKGKMGDQKWGTTDDCIFHKKISSQILLEKNKVEAHGRGEQGGSGAESVRLRTPKRFVRSFVHFFFESLETKGGKQQKSHQQHSFSAVVFKGLKKGNAVCSLCDPSKVRGPPPPPINKINEFDAHGRGTAFWRRAVVPGLNPSAPTYSSRQEGSDLIGPSEAKPKPRSNTNTKP